MDLSQAISRALGIDIHFSHTITGRTTLHVNEVLYDGHNWQQRECRDAWLAEQYNRRHFSNEPEALSFFLSWFLQNRLGLEIDPISNMYRFGPMKPAEPRIPFTTLRELRAPRSHKAEPVGVRHFLENGVLRHEVEDPIDGNISFEEV